MSEIIDGKKLASEKLLVLKEKVQSMTKKPKLVTILVGNDLASISYVAMKKKRAEEVGIISEIMELPSSVTTEEIVTRIEALNDDTSTSGILVQLPLPKSIEYERVIQSIDPTKDVDGLTGRSKFIPATVKAILELAGDLTLKTVVVVGQGKLVGRPLSDHLESEGVKVIRCDEFTEDLKSEILKGDVLVSATGVEGLIKSDMVKSGAIVIDCGAPKPEVERSVFEVAAAVTPVPGGVGPMTVASLLENTALAV